MKMCEYEFRDGRKCQEEAFEKSQYCILHTDLPEDTESKEFKRINKMKDKKVKEKIENQDFNFEGAKLSEVNFSEMKIKGTLNFIDAVIITNARFAAATLQGHVAFTGAKIRGKACFDDAKIQGETVFVDAEIKEDVSFCRAKMFGASFLKAKIGGDVSFDNAEIKEGVLFNNVEIGGVARFGRAKIGEHAFFNGAKIGATVFFDMAEIGTASFSGATIEGEVAFYTTKIKGELCFRKAKFRIPRAQEEACRKAKRIYEELGSRLEADYYFYHEMEARKKQKHRFIRFLEWPIQYVFGYGTKWERVLITWFIVVFGLGVVFWFGKGVETANSVPVTSLLKNIYFSVVTATTLGYGDYRPVPGIFQGLASFEAIFGTFMWAAFIVIFARKYMR